MDHLDAITAFVRAAERGGFSAAARDLNVSQPHVTRAVAQLEARLGARLMNRSTRRLTLTDEGRDYLDRCRAILKAVEDSDESVGVRATTLRGELRVFAPVSLGREWIVPQLAEFLDRHPALSVRLVLDDRPRDLVEERLDVAVRVGPLESSTMRARQLGKVPRLIVAAPDYFSKRGLTRPLHPVDLAAHEWLIFDGPVRVDQVRCVKDGETVEIACNGRFASNSSEALQEAVLRGHGLCLVPYWLASKALASGALDHILPDWRTSPDLPLSAVYPATRAPSEKVRRFIDWLVYSLHGEGVFGVDSDRA
ncbi:MAG: LysR family transcriptional regulator [Sphingomonas sp.]|nr:LysR family transcriptional regulator [Sphingomonas sp.]